MLFRQSQAIERVARASLRPAGGLQPPGTVSLAQGEPDFPTPEPIVEALERAVRDGYTRYGDMDGDPELRETIAENAARLSGTPYTGRSVLVSHGGAAAITAAILATVNPGDRVVLPEPTYSLYLDAVQLAGGQPVFVPNHADHHLDFDRLQAALDQARMVVLCNPVNPTGAVFGREELQRLGECLSGTDTLLLADEAYADIVYDGQPFTSSLEVDSLQERLIYVQTMSKTYAMTGWRVGYVVADEAITASIRHVHRTMNSSINAAVQRAALEAIRLGPDLAAPMLAAYQERRDYVMARIDKMERLEAHQPDGAFYVFARHFSDLPASQVIERLLAGGVAVRSGPEFGPSGEGHIRLSYAASLEKLEEGLNRIEAVFDGL
ncbi:MAG: aspartate aminotransferase [Frankiales bacterium]|nr:aspartate aminotransferase [Frankiales bacterium]